MTEEEYQRKTFIVSTDQTVRKTFDGAVAQLTGVPTPGQVPLTPGSRAPVTNLPAGAVGTHIGHVVNGFGDTPGGAALINVAMADARVAAQHATLAARNPANLDDDEAARRPCHQRARSDDSSRRGREVDTA